jgi:glycerol-3-phosphate O-acyltransferase/dihydroxyacetone phosphate acyltransferase
MRTPLLYRVSLALCRTALRVYFCKLEVSGAGRVPRTGPVILASNHPQSVTDAMVLGVCAGRMVHYLAHSGLFKNRFKAWFLGDLGVIPVYRQQDVDGAAEKNIEMFSACRTLLEKGGAIGIFPEGVSAEQRRVQQLKTGTARIALEAEQKNGWSLGTVIVPVGLSFESKRYFRTKVLVDFGVPIPASEYRRSYEADPVEAVYELTTALHEAIRRRVVNVEHGEFEALVGDVEMIYKGELLAGRGTVVSRRKKFRQDQWVAREIPRALDYFYERNPEVIWQVGRLVREYRRKLDRLRLHDDMIQKEGAAVGRESIKFLLLGVLGLPIATYGTLWNVLPYWLTGWAARRLAKDATKIHYEQLMVGTAVYLLWYLPLVYVAYRWLGGIGAIVFAATLPLAGLFARGYVRVMIRRRRMLRFAFLDMTHRYTVQKLRAERRRLIDELDAARDEYVAARLADPASKLPPSPESGDRRDEG